MSHKLTSDRSKTLYLSFKTGITIMQESFNLVATCGLCRGDIWWDRPAEMWYCSEADEGKCTKTFPLIPESAASSYLEFRHGTTPKVIANWISSWIQEPEENIRVEVE